mmetsp:Transcript_3009/g.7176  ORF Transcript_3009/g.7176 Transcript_3009/m.7176 type:complete len:313 (-) Transcript_3009:48-986(-)
MEVGSHGDVVWYANATSSMLSVVGCGCTLGMFFLLKSQRKFLMRLVVYISVSDFWLCIGNLLGKPPRDSSRCNVQAMMLTYFSLASTLWTAVFAYALSAIVNRSEDVEASESSLHMVAWGLPMIALVPTLVIAQLGPAGFWCWIENTPVGSVMRMLVFYVPLWTTMVYSLVVYWRMKRRIKRCLRQAEIRPDFEDEEDAFGTTRRLQERVSLLQRLTVLPLVLFACWAIASMNRIWQIFFPDFDSPIIDALVCGTAALQGFGNALVYGSTPAVRRELAALVQTWSGSYDDLERSPAPELPAVIGREMGARAV